MKIILLETIENLGKAGDVVDVKPGYANNYLIRQGMALADTPQNMNIVRTKKRAIEAKEAKMLEEAKETGEKLKGETLELIVRAGEGGRLYGAITSQDLADILEERGYSVDRRDIKLGEPIKELGEKEIDIHLHPEVHISIKVVLKTEDQEEEEVVAESAPEAEPAAEEAQE